MRVLLAEDTPELMLVMDYVLREKYHFEVEMAKTGAEALQFWNKESFDVLITDYNIPILSGLDVIRQIREKGGKQLIIMVTAYDRIRPEAEKFGAVFYQKPTDIRAIVQRIQEPLLVAT